MSYDTKCLQLARDFLRDEPSINDERHAHELAQACGASPFPIPLQGEVTCP